jgi:adenylylsulfate kinase
MANSRDLGAVVWFTGLPASGKSTLAAAVRERLGNVPVLLDSDALREILGATGYGRTDRDAFYAVLGRLATMLAEQGHVVLVAATAPRRAYRDAVRAAAPRFLEVHVATPHAVCEVRDRKGLYARARAGQAPDLPGLGADYESPRRPDVVADGGHDHVAAATILALLAVREGASRGETI